MMGMNAGKMFVKTEMSGILWDRVTIFLNFGGIKYVLPLRGIKEKCRGVAFFVSHSSKTRWKIILIIHCIGFVKDAACHEVAAVMNAGGR